MDVELGQCLVKQRCCVGFSDSKEQIQRLNSAYAIQGKADWKQPSLICDYIRGASNTDDIIKIECYTIIIGHVSLRILTPDMHGIECQW